MRGRRAAISPNRTGRNEFCPCGSGRKFKQCCGAVRTKAEPANAQGAAGCALGLDKGRDSLGHLTGVSRLRETAEQFQRMQSALPASCVPEESPPGRERKDAPARRDAARRQRERGIRLLDAGRLSAAVSALSRATDLDPREAASHQALGRTLLRLGRVAEAAQSLSLATTLRDDAAAYHDLGVALHQQGLHAEAIAAYRRAVELAPEMADAHVGLGRLLEASGEDEEAAQCFRRAAATTPDPEAAGLNLAHALMLEEDFPGAEGRLRHALEHNPHNGTLTKSLGDVLARQGRFTEASEAFDRALDLNPRSAAAHYAVIEARRCVESDIPRLERMLALLGDVRLGEGERLLLHFAVGKLLDDLGDYAQAMRHFDMANRIRSPGAKFDQAALAADVDRLMRRFTPGFFAANTAFGRADEVPLFIVGLPRSGTTLVEQIISSHPQVAAGGELTFWIKRATPWGIAEASYLSIETAHQLSAEYLGLLRRRRPGALRITDKQPFNLFCLGVIHLLFPQARIIQCRRHPVDTCLSMYFTHFKQVSSFGASKADLAEAYRHYARLMDHWRAVLPPGRFIEIAYEDLIADREAVTRRLIAFSGLEWHDACLQPERNTRAVATASLWQARQPVYGTSVGRWRNYQPWLDQLGSLLPVDS